MGLTVTCPFCRKKFNIKFGSDDIKSTIDKKAYCYCKRCKEILMLD